MDATSREFALHYKEGEKESPANLLGIWRASLPSEEGLTWAEAVPQYKRYSGNRHGPIPLYGGNGSLLVDDQGEVVLCAECNDPAQVVVGGRYYYCHRHEISIEVALAQLVGETVSAIEFGTEPFRHVRIETAGGVKLAIEFDTDPPQLVVLTDGRAVEESGVHYPDSSYHTG